MLLNIMLLNIVPSAYYMLVTVQGDRRPTSPCSCDSLSHCESCSLHTV